MGYAPGADGTGAVVREVKDGSRYPGDPQGQAFVAGVKPDWGVKSINGNPVAGATLESIMESLDDEVLDPVEALSLNLKEKGVSTDSAQIAKTQVDKTFRRRRAPSSSVAATRPTCPSPSFSRRCDEVEISSNLQ